MKRSREQRYPETKTFHYHNQNPKNRITGDCTFRAISLATGLSYNDVVMDMAKMQCKTGYALNDKKGIERYMESIGWVKCKQPRKTDGTKFTGKEWCKELQNMGSTASYIANIGGHHIVCIKEGKVWDIWDSTDGCIGNFWVKNSVKNS